VTGGAVSGTGIAGYTLGGGLGWLMAKYGLAADNLLAVELVTAEGDVLHVDADAPCHSDLFWALRGGHPPLRADGQRASGWPGRA
jgi:FAD/FMN-containing dehydrogenase